MRVGMMKLNRREREQIDAGLAVTFMHAKEIINNPEMLEKYTKPDRFFPVYLKGGDKEVLLIGVKAKRTTGS
jgi:hypothetical protein